MSVSGVQLPQWFDELSVGIKNENRAGLSVMSDVDESGFVDGNAMWRIPIFMADRKLAPSVFNGVLKITFTKNDRFLGLLQQLKYFGGRRRRSFSGKVLNVASNISKLRTSLNINRYANSYCRFGPRPRYKENAYVLVELLVIFCLKPISHHF